jgi:hypothetical protein
VLFISHRYGTAHVIRSGHGLGLGCDDDITRYDPEIARLAVCLNRCHQSTGQLWIEPIPRGRARPRPPPCRQSG